MTRRRPGPISALFWLMIAGCALVAIAEVNPPITAPLAFVLLVLIVAGAVASHQAKKEQRVARSVPRPSPTLTARRLTSKARRCGHCGAPAKPGAERCYYCSTSLLDADVEERTVRWGACSRAWRS